MPTINIRSVTLYYQTDAQAGGNAGWAIDSEGDHTSGGIEVGEADDGEESLSDVREAFARAWPEIAAQIQRWDDCQEGGWTGRK